MLLRMRRERISFALLVGMQTGAATMENSMEVPQKVKNRTTLQPSNCTTRYLSNGYMCAVSKGHMHPHVYSSTINNSQSMERAQMSISGWMDKEDEVSSITRQSKRMKSWDTCVTQPVKHLTLDFGSGQDLMVGSSSPMSGSVLTVWSLLGFSL